jgi:hypothetical protein
MPARPTRRGDERSGSVVIAVLGLVRRTPRHSKRRSDERKPMLFSGVAAQLSHAEKRHGRDHRERPPHYHTTNTNLGTTCCLCSEIIQLWACFKINICMPLGGGDKRHSHGAYLALREHQQSAPGVLE